MQNPPTNSNPIERIYYLEQRMTRLENRILYLENQLNIHLPPDKYREVKQ